MGKLHGGHNVERIGGFVHLHLIKDIKMCQVGPVLQAPGSGQEPAHIFCCGIVVHSHRDTPGVLGINRPIVLPGFIPVGPGTS